MIQQNDKPDLFDRLIRVPCLDHVLEPPLQCHATHNLQFLGSLWKCKGCDAQLSVRVPKLSQKLTGCKPKPSPKEAPPSRPVNTFFQPVLHSAAVSVPKAQGKPKPKAKPKGLVQTKLHFHG